MNLDFFILFSSFIVIFCTTVYILAYRGHRQNKSAAGLKYPGMTIIVPVWNEGKTIADTLDSLLKVKERYRGELEIIVIDDHSTDNSYSIIKSYASANANLKCCKKDPMRNRGKSESLNQGIDLAGHDIVGCVDADSYPDPESLNYIAEEFTDPRVGAVTTKLIVKKPKHIVEWFQQVEYIFSNFILMSFDALDSIYITRGPLSLYRKDVMKKINGFLPAGQTPTEDMEITFRIRKAGYSIRGSKKAKVYTSVMKTWKALFWQRMRWNRGTLINLWLHRDIFFDSRYGMLSMFILPTATLMISMVGVIICYLLYTIGSGCITQVQKLYWIISTGYYPDFYQIKEAVIGGDNSFAFHNMMLFFVVMGIYFMVNGFGFHESKERFSMRYILFVALTPVIYNPVIIFFWASAMIMHTSKIAVRWR
ncbi:MAG: glycosyltransferase [Spirochaetia bacterium]|jgi:cellulose synthase/poly-beta-1,6-N-acetylglucosamine synthase-like glycosyltransferase|nr:glycosyltransferase [Spirochaetia bacterium]